MSLLPAERAQYSAIIDNILAEGDLSTISAKTIMKGLSASLEVDLSEKKKAIKELIMERFDHASSPTIPTPPPTNGTHMPTKETKVKSETPATNLSSAAQSPTPSPSISPCPSSSEEEITSDIKPPSKKRKNPPTSTSTPSKVKKEKKEVDDAKLAAMLQAQENSRGRATRGGGLKKNKVVKKRAPKRKSEKKVGAEDDSEIEVGSDGEVKEKVKKGGFHKLYHLSAPLADLVGEPTLSRPQVVKKIWIYIKAHDLQDPSDKRQIMCDEKMQLVFKTDKVHMFTMNKILGKQLYDVEE